MFLGPFLSSVCGVENSMAWLGGPLPSVGDFRVWYLVSNGVWVGGAHQVSRFL